MRLVAKVSCVTEMCAIGRWLPRFPAWRPLLSAQAPRVVPLIRQLESESLYSLSLPLPPPCR